MRRYYDCGGANFSSSGLPSFRGVFVAAWCARGRDLTIRGTRHYNLYARSRAAYFKRASKPKNPTRRRRFGVCVCLLRNARVLCIMFSQLVDLKIKFLFASLAYCRYVCLSQGFSHFKFLLFISALFQENTRPFSVFLRLLSCFLRILSAHQIKYLIYNF
jgi:hypothetical protein